MTISLLREIKGRCYVVTKSRNPTLCEREQELKEFRIERNVDLRDKVTSLTLCNYACIMRSFAEEVGRCGGAGVLGVSLEVHRIREFSTITSS